MRAAVALAADGAVVAGDGAIAAPARALLDCVGRDAGHVLPTPDGAVLVACAPSLAAVVVAGPRALLPLLAHDLDALLADTQDDGAGVRGAAAAARGASAAAVAPAVGALADAVIAAATGETATSPRSGAPS